MVLAVLLAVAAASCGWNQPAAKVGKVEISEDQLKADVEALRTVPELATLFGAEVPEKGPVPASVTANMLSLRISQLVLAARFESSKVGLPLDEANRRAEDERTKLADIDEQLTLQLGSPETYAKVPASLREILRTFLLYRDLLLGEVPEDEVLTTVSGIFAASDISVAPRYGSWDSTTFSVVPPEGPGQSPVPSNGPAGS